ncbi:MAG: LPS export ABC transporter ATP-binding protein [Rickettsiales bacterium]
MSADLPSLPRHVLEAENLGKSYNNRPVVRDVSVTVKSGEVVGLLGPNGAGKTTSFYMIMGLVKPDRGRVFLNGQDVTALPVYRRARRGVSYLPQETSIFRGMTVEDNVMAALQISEPDLERRKARLEELLGDFSVSHLRRSLGVTLSGGERRRVEIARALAINPQFILLDEPLAGVDPLVVADVKKLIKNLKKRHIGVLITDHNVRDALDMIDRAYIIYNGAVLKHGTPDAIVSDEDVKRVYLGEDFYYGRRGER